MYSVEGQILQIFIEVFVILLVTSAILLRITATEMVRIWRAHAGTPQSRWLRWAVIGFLGSLLLSLALATSPITIGVAIWPVDIGFFAGVLTFEIVDALGPQVGAYDNLDDVLGPWRLRQAPSSNGQHAGPVGSAHGQS